MARAPRLHRGGYRFESYIAHMKYFVYIIYNKKFDKFYIGQTNNLNRRKSEHNLGLSEYTSKYNSGWEIVFKEEYFSRSDAMQREKFLKKQKNKAFYRKIAGLVV